MNDSYAEWLVKRKVPSYAYAVNAVMAFLTLVCLFLAMTMGVLAIVLLLVVGFLTYLSYRNTRLEFEYLFVSGQLSVDKIMGKAKRKRAYECSMEEIQVIAPSDSYVLNDYKASNPKLLDFSSHEAGAKTYTAVVRHGGEVTKVIFEPNDKMLQCFRQTAPRKVVQ